MKALIVIVSVFYVTVLVPQSTAVLNWKVYEKTDSFKEFVQLLEYPVEAYSIQTIDDYILRLHRIPPKDPATAKVVFIMHGMFCSSIDWVLIGRGKAIALILHDLGYDVWLGNGRGNTYSRSHVQISPDSKKFWDFSWHEIGYYDIPTMINFALKQSKATQLDYIGHSQGVTTFMVMTSLRPKMNAKIRTMIGMSPITFVSNMQSQVLRLLAKNIDTVERIFKTFMINELLPSHEINAILGSFFCSENSHTQELCANLLFVAIGPDPIHLNRTLLPAIFTNIPAGISVRQFLHYGQMINSGVFQPYDFKSRNIFIYKQTSPTPYPLDKISGLDCHFYYGTTDIVMDQRDVALLQERLTEAGRNTVSVTTIPNFNHLDYLFATNVTGILYESVIAALAKNNGGTVKK